MFGRLAAGLIVIGLAIGVWALWPESKANPTTAPTTLGPTVLPSTTVTTTPTSSAATTQVDDGLITTEAEAEELLRTLWFGWFEGIYNQDENRIREVVVTEKQVAAAVAQFGAMTFLDEPSTVGISVENVDVMKSDETCTAIWAEIQISQFNEASFSGVHVFRYAGNRWLFASIWEFRNDLWESDCGASLG